jgi:CubicO group peptidase (beta-lactamase class C family)
MKRFLLLAFLTIGFLETNGQNSSEIITKLDAYLNSANNAYRFNGVALVLLNNEILLNKGYGFSNMNAKTLNTPETRFPILSITKTFTSTIILKLQDEGKLSVKNKLTKYFPDYPNGSKITIHHLLTHSSGIYNYTGCSRKRFYLFEEARTVEVGIDDDFGATPTSEKTQQQSGFMTLGNEDELKS